MGVQMIKWNTPVFGSEELSEVVDVLSTGYVSEGPKTKALEEKLAEIVGVKHVIMTTSCTAALYLAIEADKKIKQYDRGYVVIPDLTFVGTKNAVELANLYVDIKDVDSETYLLKEAQCETNTRIVIPVNLLGRTVNPKIVSGEDVTIICDNAGCLGSSVANGTVGCYSLQANKIINCGQGGFCATDSDEYAKVIRQLKDFGRKEKDENDTTGFNFKFNDILAAITLGQLTSLRDRRNKLWYQYAEYKSRLNELGDFMPYDFDRGQIPLWMEFFPYGGEKSSRDLLFDFLKEKGIECRKPWKPFNWLPNAKKYYEHCIWLPSGQGLTQEQQDKVIRTIKEFYNVK